MNLSKMTQVLNENGFEELSLEYKLDLIQTLWESLLEGSDPTPTLILEWQKQELDRRKTQYEANPESFLSWEEVKANILAKHI